MPNIILDLSVDRVDLVNEGANSAAFIRLYKGKEVVSDMNFEELLAKMKPENADIVRAEIARAKEEVPAETADELKEAKDALETSVSELEKAKDSLKGVEEELAKAKETTSEVSEEEVLKGLDPAVQEIFKSIKAQKEAAETIAKALTEQKATDEAIAKSKELVNLPVEEAKLVELAKSVSDEVFEVLKAASVAIGESDLLIEKGKGKGDNAGTDAWTRIEKKADAIVLTDKITKEHAIKRVIQESPELYREYLNGGAN